MATTQAEKMAAIITDSEPATIYKILAREELDIASRNKFLKKFRSSVEGLGVLEAALIYATQVEQRAVATVKQDPYDRSGYNDYTAKTKIPQRVIADLEDNIRMGKIAQAHPKLFTKNIPVQHVAVDSIPAANNNPQHVTIDNMPWLNIHKY